MHVLRIAIPANLTHEEGGFSLALEGLRIAIPANLTYEEGGFSLALEGMSGALSSLPSRV